MLSISLQGCFICAGTITLVLVSNHKEYVLLCFLNPLATCDITIRKQRITKLHDDVINWKHFRRYWPFVKGIHLSPVDSRHKGQWRGALMFSLVGAWTKSWANPRDAADLRRHGTHYDVTVIVSIFDITLGIKTAQTHFFVDSFRHISK